MPTEWAAEPRASAVTWTPEDAGETVSWVTGSAETPLWVPQSGTLLVDQAGAYIVTSAGLPILLGG